MPVLLGDRFKKNRWDFVTGWESEEKQDLEMGDEALTAVGGSSGGWWFGEGSKIYIHMISQ